jgi:hypothetical protein
MKLNRWLQILCAVILVLVSLSINQRSALAGVELTAQASHCSLAAPVNLHLELGTVVPGTLSGAPAGSAVPVDCFLVPVTGLSSPLTVASLESWLNGGAERIIMALPRVPAALNAVPVTTGWLDAGAGRYLWFAAAQPSGGWRDAGAGTR